MRSLLDLVLPCRLLAALPKKRGPTEARPGRPPPTRQWMLNLIYGYPKSSVRKLKFREVGDLAISRFYG